MKNTNKFVQLETTDFESQPSKNQNNSIVTIKEIKEEMKPSYGNMHTLSLGGDPIIVLGPNYFFYLIFSSLIFASFFSIFIYIGQRIPDGVRIGGYLVYGFQFISYTLAAFKNPGIPSLKNYQLCLTNPENFKKCLSCNLMVDLNSSITYHCSECNCCIEGYDHHCPWTTKCIGKGNIIWFYCFVFSTFLYFVYLFIAISNLKV